jgi:hypothetical protein
MYYIGYGDKQKESNFATNNSLLLLHLLHPGTSTKTQNVFGWALSYQQLTYDWKILNIREGRRVLFNYALFHFLLFAVCVFFYLRPPAKKHQFAPVRHTEAEFDDLQESELKH